MMTKTIIAPNSTSQYRSFLKTFKNETVFLKLYACCLPVKGARRSIICDVQRQEFHFIPNALCEILQNHLEKPIEEIKKVYENEVDEIIEEYVVFLIQNDLAFLTHEPGSFPDIDKSWKFPALITNAILEIDDTSQHQYGKIFKELDEMGCKAIQLKLYSALPLTFVQNLLNYTNLGRLEAIELLIKYTVETNEDCLQALSKTYPRISHLIVHSAPETRSIEGDTNVRIVYLKESIESSQNCGCIHPSHFRINLSLFTEALQFNSCLNGKVAIDVNSRVKNCPAIHEEYGNVNEVSLNSIVLNKNFKELWNINKDQIEVCKDCEFRYICTDCRAFISKNDDLYSKPAKCSYNPYNAIWEDPEDNSWILKQSSSAK